MRFTKMHGIGNDYVYVNAFTENVADPAKLATIIADRHFGVGGDGLILVAPPEAGVQADVRMRMFNADGSESEMCGNGVRCVCKYAHDHGITAANPMRIQTGNGVLTLRYTVDDRNKVKQVTVDMGEPILDLPKVPVDPAQVKAISHPHQFELSIDGPLAQTFKGTFVSMGNPHVTIYVDDVARVDLEKIGPLLENHKAFPRRINVHFVQVHSPTELTMRTWERGSGITLACGTGASAVCVSGVLTGKNSRKTLIHLPGGDLELAWDEATNHVFMTGPATEVFEGVWPH